MLVIDWLGAFIKPLQKTQEHKILINLKTIEIWHFQLIIYIMTVNNFSNFRMKKNTIEYE